MSPRWLPFSAVPVLFAAVLVLAAAADSRPTAGISVTAKPVEVSLVNLDPSSGVASYTATASATWSPEAPATEGAIEVKNLADGSVQLTVAASLSAFSKKAARDLLHTGQ